MTKTRYMCQPCGKYFLSDDILQYHRIVYHFNGGVECLSCPKKFPNFAILSKHLKAHTKKYHSCNICCEVCRSELHLFAHLTVFHKYHSALVCDVCKQKLSTISNLVNHYMRKHPTTVLALEQKAEIFCSIHSSRAFPEECWLLDSVLNKNVNQEQSEADEIVHGYKIEPEKDVSNICPKKGALVSRNEVVTPPATSKQVMSRCHPWAETKPVNEIFLDSNAQLLLQEFGVLYPTCKFNKTDFEDCASGLQPVSAPDDNLIIKIYDEIIDNDGKNMYRCILCGLQYEDIISLYADHIPETELLCS